MSAKYTVDKVAALVAGCTNEAVPPAVRELVAKHLLDSIGCTIGAQVTDDIKAVVDAFGGKPMCTLIGGGRTSPDRAVFESSCGGRLSRIWSSL